MSSESRSRFCIKNKKLMLESESDSSSSSGSAGKMKDIDFIKWRNEVLGDNPSSLNIIYRVMDEMAGDIRELRGQLIEKMTVNLRILHEAKNRVLLNVEVEKTMNQLATLKLALSFELKFVQSFNISM